MERAEHVNARKTPLWGRHKGTRNVVQEDTNWDNPPLSCGRRPVFQGSQDKPARPRHARATPVPPKPIIAYSPRHARAMPAPRPCHPSQ
eukprot:gene15008-biopygen3639